MENKSKEAMTQCKKCKQFLPLSETTELEIKEEGIGLIFGAPKMRKEKWCNDCIDSHNKAMKERYG